MPMAFKASGRKLQAVGPKAAATDLKSTLPRPIHLLHCLVEAFRHLKQVCIGMAMWSPTTAHARRAATAGKFCNFLSTGRVQHL